MFLWAYSGTYYQRGEMVPVLSPIIYLQLWEQTLNTYKAMLVNMNVFAFDVMPSNVYNMNWMLWCRDPEEPYFVRSSNAYKCFGTITAESGKTKMTRGMERATRKEHETRK